MSNPIDDTYRERYRELRRILWALLRRHGPLRVDDITFSLANDPKAHIVSHHDPDNRTTAFSATFTDEVEPC